MEKRINCEHCRKLFVLTGNRGAMREEAQSVTCPICGHLQEVLWPIDMGWNVFVPDESSSS